MKHINRRKFKINKYGKSEKIENIRKLKIYDKRKVLNVQKLIPTEPDLCHLSSTAMT